MTALSVKTISASKAGEIIERELMWSGVYYLSNNRAGRNEQIIPYRKIRGQVFYTLNDVMRFIIKTKPSTKTTVTTLKKIELSEDVWLMGPSLSDEGEPVVQITRGAGMEILTPDDAREIGWELMDQADMAETLLIKAA
jgi:hypothetical protein